MTKDMTLAELQAQIEELQNKAKAIIEAEKAGVIEEIKGKIAQYGISSSELGFKSIDSSKVANASGAGSTKAPTVPMYKNPNTGETWHGGKGARPKWIQTIFDEQIKKDKTFNQQGLHSYLKANGYGL